MAVRVVASVVPKLVQYSAPRVKVYDPIAEHIDGDHEVTAVSLECPIYRVVPPEQHDGRRRVGHFRQVQSLKIAVIRSMRGMQAVVAQRLRDLGREGARHTEHVVESLLIVGERG